MHTKKTKRVYLLRNLKTDEISVWSNLKKLHEHIYSQTEGFLGYQGLYRHISMKKTYKFIKDDEIWVVLVKDVN